jgi:hypothetical protein
MKLNLNLAEDAELRREVRKLLEGQIKAIARDELTEIVLKAVPEHKRSEEYITELIQKGISTALNNAFSTNSNSSAPNLVRLDELIRKEISLHIKSLQVRIDQKIDEAISEYINFQASGVLDEKIKAQVKKVIRNSLE